jgi:hypothetical protein
MEKLYKMPVNDLESWLEKLRSGEYEQAHGELYSASENAYCCLGVYALIKEVNLEDYGTEGTLADIPACETESLNIFEPFLADVNRRSHDDFFIDTFLAGLNDCVSSRETINKAIRQGIVFPDMNIIEDCLDTDSRKNSLTFAEIADVIEANFEPVYEGKEDSFMDDDNETMDDLRRQISIRDEINNYNNITIEKQAKQLAEQGQLVCKLQEQLKNASSKMYNITDILTSKITWFNAPRKLKKIRNILY